jgi:hypothetical protein
MGVDIYLLCRDPKLWKFIKSFQCENFEFNGIFHSKYSKNVLRMEGEDNSCKKLNFAKHIYCEGVDNTKNCAKMNSQYCATCVPP